MLGALRVILRKYSLYDMRIVMQTFIYNEDFFYRKILSSEKESIKEIIKEKDNFYSIKKIPKKNGVRTIACLEKNSDLAKIQQSIRINFLNTISIPNFVYGFVSGHSYIDFLKPHVNKKYYLRLDIKNFFESINYKTLEEVFNYYFRINDETNKEKLLDFIELVTLNGKVPQGAITSPTLSNIVFRQLDLRIYKYCKKFKITYTRYADDLLFSSENNYLHKEYFIKKIKYIISEMGFKLNNKKVRYDKDFISLNGFVIEDSVRISRKKLKELTRVLFILERYKNEPDVNEIILKVNSNGLNRKFSNTYSLINFLAGYRAFLLQFLDREFLEKEGNRKINRYLERIQDSIVSIRAKMDVED